MQHSSLSLIMLFALSSVLSDQNTNAKHFYLFCFVMRFTFSKISIAAVVVDFVFNLCIDRDIQ